MKMAANIVDEAYSDSSFGIEKSCRIYPTATAIKQVHMMHCKFKK